jgi:predicted acylesterase/phospholipase RssA
MNVKCEHLTPDCLKDAQEFFRNGTVGEYLPPSRSVEESLLCALATSSESVILFRSESNAVIGLSGLVAYPERQDAEFWCVAEATDPHYWIVSAAAELMLRKVFGDPKLHSAHTNCLREDSQSANALQDAGLVEEGIQHACRHVDGRWQDRQLFGMVRDDWNTDPAERNKRFVAQCRREDRGPYYAALILQAVLVATLGYLCFVAAGWIGLSFSLIAAVAVLSIDWWMLQQIRQMRRIGPRMLVWGFFLSLFFSGLLLLQVLYRIRWEGGVSTSWIVVAVLIVLLGVLHFAAILMVMDRHVPWLWAGAFVVGVPIILMYIPLSETAEEWIMSSPQMQGSINWREKKDDRAKVIAQRRSWSGDSPDQPRVAVALSGGGYRAALIHAGVLAALDRHRVPIRYLTTVSGGSIIGAHYALGYTPAEFIRSAREQKPGLAFNKLSVFSSLGTWLFPWKSDADVYADHFARSYFGRATIHDLPDTPVLIVNATDIEADPQNAREVFFKEIAERAPHLAESIRVADAVAASGAFPIAFEPKTIRWFAAEGEPGPQSVVRRRFVDGGVLENMGLEGLRRYLSLRKAMKLDIEKPDVLIVSDASLPSKGSPLPAKVELADLVRRLQDISYSAFSRSLLSQFTGQAKHAQWVSNTAFALQHVEVPYSQIDPELEAGSPQVLRVIVIPATAPQLHAKLQELAPRYCLFRGRGIGEVQHEVASFETLKELAPEEVEKGAWLGSALVTLYWDAIQCSLDKARNPKMSCASPPAVPPECPEIEHLVSGTQK